MRKQLTLRLLPADQAALDTAAAAIAGPAGAPYLGRMTVIRKALAAFIDLHGARVQDLPT